MFIRRRKNPIYMTKLKESLIKPLRNLSIKENFKKKPNLGFRSAEEVIDNASFKSAKDELDSKAEEQL